MTSQIRCNNFVNVTCTHQQNAKCRISHCILYKVCMYMYEVSTHCRSLHQNHGCRAKLCGVGKHLLIS